MRKFDDIVKSNSIQFLLTKFVWTLKVFYPSNTDHIICNEAGEKGNVQSIVN